MEIVNCILAGALSSLAAYQIFKLKDLQRKASKNSSLLNDLAFKYKDNTEFIKTQIARVHYDLLKRSNRLVFHADTSLEEALAHPGAREILIGRKMIRKRHREYLTGTLAERARECQLSLEPILIALNDLEKAP